MGKCTPGGNWGDSPPTLGHSPTQAMEYMSDFLKSAAKPGLLRILAAIFYDLWLIAALWMLGATVDTFARHALYGAQGGGNYLLLWAWWAISPLLFFTWFWTHGGQTLGMRSWRIRVVDSKGEPIGWPGAVRRYVAAFVSWVILGLGFVWIVFDRDGHSWHDRLSGSYLVLTEKRGRKK